MSEAAVNARPCPGWLGKIPNVGDFVSRRLPDDFTQAWDDWLQSGMARARADLGAAWLSRYLLAPVQRFWLAPQLLGDSGWAGTLMPSVDGVGRHFPLTIALALPDHTLAAVLATSAWFRAIDTAGRKVLDVNFSANDLDAELAQVAPMPVEVPDDLQAQQLAASWLAPDQPQKMSLWWCGDALLSVRLDGFRTLPPPATFGALWLAPGHEGDTP